MYVHNTNIFYRLAAVQDGQYCFCSDDESLLSGATKTSDSLCSIPCHYNASGETCGGYLHNEVFKVPDLIEGLYLHDPGVNGKCNKFSLLVPGNLAEEVFDT